MKALASLENWNTSVENRLAQLDSSAFCEKKVDKKIRCLTQKIKKEFTEDYTKPVNFKKNEKERVEKIFIDYLTGKSDDFNSHYIQLLVWNLIDLKVLNVKKLGKQSIFEYSPNPLAPYTVVEKTFRLFQNKRIDPNKISFGLVLNYLNNHRIASNRYKAELKKYLKTIKFCKDSNVYFNVKNVDGYMIKKLRSEDVTKPFPESLLKLRIRLETFNTVYFSDAWYEWMFKRADLTSRYVLENFDCNYFRICDENMQKILLAKIICDNAKKVIFGVRVNLEEICLKYIFPSIKNGNPLEKEFWNLNYKGIYKNYLDSAWFFINMTDFEERK